MTDSAVIEWGDREDDITVADDGIYTYTGCHGCHSRVLDEAGKIRLLRDALTDWLEEHDA